MRLTEVLCHFLRTWVGCGHSGGQSRYCGGHPRWREARGGPHASLRAPVARRAGAHARTRAVRWRWWKRGAMLGLVWVISILRMVQCVLIGWRIICFRGHDFTGPPGGFSLRGEHCCFHSSVSLEARRLAPQEDVIFVTGYGH